MRWCWAAARPWPPRWCCSAPISIRWRRTPAHGKRSPVVQLGTGRAAALIPWFVARRWPWQWLPVVGLVAAHGPGWGDRPAAGSALIRLLRQHHREPERICGQQVFGSALSGAQRFGAGVGAGLGPLAGMSALGLLQLSWRPYRLVLPHRLITSRGALVERSGWLLRLQAPNGALGWGEAAAPLRPAQPSLAAAVAVLPPALAREELEQQIAAAASTTGLCRGTALAELDGAGGAGSAPRARPGCCRPGMRPWRIWSACSPATGLRNRRSP